MKKALDRKDYNNNKSKDSKINRENYFYKKKYLMKKEDKDKDEFSKENSSKSSDKIENNRKVNKNNINKISFWRKKLIIKNNVKNKNNIYYSDLNNNIDLIRKKKELEEEREKERKIMEWFYINDISLTKRDLYNNLTIQIQSVFRGWKFRKKITIIKNNSHKNNNNKNIYFSNIINGYTCLKRIYLLLMKRNLKYFLSKIKEKDNQKEKIKLLGEIKELINQNNELQKKLRIILNDNNNLKKEAEIYKDYKDKYKEIFSQFEKMFKMNNNFIEENQNLKKRLNNLRENAYDSEYNYFIIDKLKSINYLSNKNNRTFIDKNTKYELKLLKIEKLINLNILAVNLHEVQNLNKINKNYFLIKENNLDIIPFDNKLKKEEMENNIKIKILKKYIDKKSQIIKDILGRLFLLYKDKINEIKIKEQKEIINNLKTEIEILKNKIKEKGKDKKEEDKILKIQKLKSVFEFKKLFLKKELCKYFLSFYYKTFINENICKRKNTLVENITSAPITPNIKEKIPSILIPNKINYKDIIQNNNKENKENKYIKDFNININYEKNEKERKIKEEKEEKERKERILKSRNLRKLLARRVHEKKDNIRKYFYKYAHISMMIKIRSKLIEMKRKEIEKRSKEEKRENAKYKIIQSYRNKEERIASIFNKLDKKVSFIKRNALNAWNVKSKVMAIKLILVPLKNNKHKKKKKKKSNKNEDNKSEENKNEDEKNKTEIS